MGRYAGKQKRPLGLNRQSSQSTTEGASVRSGASSSIQSSFSADGSGAHSNNSRQRRNKPTSGSESGGGDVPDNLVFVDKQQPVDHRAANLLPPRRGSTDYTDEGGGYHQSTGIGAGRQHQVTKGAPVVSSYTTAATAATTTAGDSRHSQGSSVAANNNNTAATADIDMIKNHSYSSRALTDYFGMDGNRKMGSSGRSEQRRKPDSVAGSGSLTSMSGDGSSSFANGKSPIISGKYSFASRSTFDDDDEDDEESSSSSEEEEDNTGGGKNTFMRAALEQDHRGRDKDEVAEENEGRTAREQQRRKYGEGQKSSSSSPPYSRGGSTSDYSSDWDHSNGGGKAGGGGYASHDDNTQGTGSRYGGAQSPFRCYAQSESSQDEDYDEPRLYRKVERASGGGGPGGGDAAAGAAAAGVGGKPTPSSSWRTPLEEGDEASHDDSRPMAAASAAANSREVSTSSHDSSPPPPPYSAAIASSSRLGGGGGTTTSVESNSLDKKLSAETTSSWDKKPSSAESAFRVGATNMHGSGLNTVANSEGDAFDIFPQEDGGLMGNDNYLDDDLLVAQAKQPAMKSGWAGTSPASNSRRRSPVGPGGFFPAASSRPSYADDFDMDRKPAAQRPSVGNTSNMFPTGVTAASTMMESEFDLQDSVCTPVRIVPKMRQRDTKPDAIAASFAGAFSFAKKPPPPQSQQQQQDELGSNPSPPVNVQYQNSDEAAAARAAVAAGGEAGEKERKDSDWHDRKMSLLQSIDVDNGLRVQVSDLTLPTVLDDPSVHTETPTESTKSNRSLISNSNKIRAGRQMSNITEETGGLLASLTLKQQQELRQELEQHQQQQEDGGGGSVNPHLFARQSSLTSNPVRIEAREPGQSRKLSMEEVPIRPSAPSSAAAAAAAAAPAPGRTAPTKAKGYPLERKLSAEPVRIVSSGPPRRLSCDNGSEVHQSSHNNMEHAVFREVPVRAASPASQEHQSHHSQGDEYHSEETELHTPEIPGFLPSSGASSSTSSSSDSRSQFFSNASSKTSETEVHTPAGSCKSMSTADPDSPGLTRRSKGKTKVVDYDDDDDDYLTKPHKASVGGGAIPHGDYGRSNARTVVAAPMNNLGAKTKSSRSHESSDDSYGVLTRGQPQQQAPASPGRMGSGGGGASQDKRGGGRRQDLLYPQVQSVASMGMGLNEPGSPTPPPPGAGRQHAKMFASTAAGSTAVAALAATGSNGGGEGQEEEEIHYEPHDDGGGDDDQRSGGSGSRGSYDDDEEDDFESIDDNHDGSRSGGSDGSEGSHPRRQSRGETSAESVGTSDEDYSTGSEESYDRSVDEEEEEEEEAKEPEDRRTSDSRQSGSSSPYMARTEKQVRRKSYESSGIRSHTTARGFDELSSMGGGSSFRSDLDQQQQPMADKGKVDKKEIDPNAIFDAANAIQMDYFTRSFASRHSSKETRMSRIETPDKRRPNDDSNSNTSSSDMGAGMLFKSDKRGPVGVTTVASSRIGRADGWADFDAGVRGQGDKWDASENREEVAYDSESADKAAGGAAIRPRHVKDDYGEVSAKKKGSEASYDEDSFAKEKSHGHSSDDDNKKPWSVPVDSRNTGARDDGSQYDSRSEYSEDNGGDRAHRSDPFKDDGIVLRDDERSQGVRTLEDYYSRGSKGSASGDLDSETDPKSRRKLLDEVQKYSEVDLEDITIDPAIADPEDPVEDGSAVSDRQNNRDLLLGISENENCSGSTGVSSRSRTASLASRFSARSNRSGRSKQSTIASGRNMSFGLPKCFRTDTFRKYKFLILGVILIVVIAIAGTMIGVFLPKGSGAAQESAEPDAPSMSPPLTDQRTDAPTGGPPPTDGIPPPPGGFNPPPEQDDSFSNPVVFKTKAWAQVGADISPQTPSLRQDNGQAMQMGYSVSLSKTGHRIAVGSRYDSSPTLGTKTGSVRIFEFVESGSFWHLIGVVYGEFPGDEFGFTVSLSENGNVFAAGSLGNDARGDKSGQVRVFAFKAQHGTWMQLGDALYGNGPDELFGMSVSLSRTGHRLAVGSPHRNGMTGAVAVFEFDLMDYQWEQMNGGTQDGNNVDDFFGWSVALSADGTTFAAGTAKEQGIGYVQLYRWNSGSGDWEFSGKVEGESAGDLFGYSVSFSEDGRVLAVGAPDGVDKRGYVQVYSNVVNPPSPSGRIEGSVQGDELGFSLQLSDDGKRLVIGSPLNDDMGKDTGRIRVYQSNGNSWDEGRAVHGTDVVGDAGFSVSMSKDGRRFAYGVPFRSCNQQGTGSCKGGYVRVHQ